MATKGNNIPLAIDDDFLAEIDRVAKSKNETRSAVMRAAIRAGLPLVKSGGAADVLTLDSELSRDVDEMAKAYKRTRNAILIEAIQKGARAVNVRGMYENAEFLSTEEAEARIKGDPDAEPHLREVRRAGKERGALQIRFDDLLQHVPQAKRRADLMGKLYSYRHQPGGIHGGQSWGCGLSTEEIEWEVGMYEKHGVHSKWPKAETERQKAAREKEHQARNSPLASESPKPKPAKKKSSK